MTEKHLWEVDHPYYCNEGNYFASESVHGHFSRWQDFIAEFGDSDPDLNLLFRWDWDAPHVEDDSEKPIKWVGDENYRDSVLKIFWMGQRKGLYHYSTVDVCRADEPMVREFLQSRWNHFKTLWEPLS